MARGERAWSETPSSLTTPPPAGARSSAFYLPLASGAAWVVYLEVDDSGGDISRFETRAICASMS